MPPWMAPRGGAPKQVSPAVLPGGRRAGAGAAGLSGNAGAEHDGDRGPVAVEVVGHGARRSLNAIEEGRRGLHEADPPASASPKPPRVSARKAPTAVVKARGASRWERWPACASST